MNARDLRFLNFKSRNSLITNELQLIKKTLDIHRILVYNIALLNMEESFQTQCRFCGETLNIPEDEHLLGEGHIHLECEMDEEERTTTSPVDLF